MKITQIGRTEHRLLSAAVEKALAQVAADFGVTFKSEGGIVGSMKGMIKLGVEVVPAAGGMSAAETEFRAYAAMIGMKPEHWGQTFISNGKLFKISGLKTNAPKYDLLADEVGGQGRTFKFVGRNIARHFEVKKAA